ncbi:acyl--CoA ligase [Eggerthellaceae bacterium zg-997]|nr:acyl--CoA ligase [Eggerthellaceae bacterium zg-997]
MPITAFLERNAATKPTQVALVEVNPERRERRGGTWREFELVEANPSKRYRRELTWREFDENANRFANLLKDGGVVRGDKVGILLMNCLEWLPIYFGILKAGAVAVPLNFRYTSDEIKYCLDLADVTTCVIGPEFVERVEDIIDRIPLVKSLFYVGENCPEWAESYFACVWNQPSGAPDVTLSAEDDAAIYFSSGTTGFPKAILHRHRALDHAAAAEVAHHGQTGDDVFLCIPPLYHTGAKMHWFGSLASGSRAVLLRGVRPDWIMRTVSEERCSIVWLLVPWAQDILEALDNGSISRDRLDLSRWRLMHIGAQPVPRSLIKRWNAYFPHHQYDTNYGLSEGIGPGSVHLGVENIDRLGAIGVPGHGWQAEVRREDGSCVAPGAHEAGELCLKGAGVMVGYYKNPQATAETLRDGWLYTGDMAEVDAEGFIYLVDRKKDVIISGGENIYPVQVEDHLSAHPSIHDVAVIGVPDARLGEIACAVVDLKDGCSCTEAELDQFCARLPRYKRPRRWVFAPVPRNPTGKIEKPLLRERYGVSRLVAHENEA